MERGYREGFLTGSVRPLDGDSIKVAHLGHWVRCLIFWCDVPVTVRSPLSDLSPNFFGKHEARVGIIFDLIAAFKDHLHLF